MDHIRSTEDPVNIESTGICIDAFADHFITAVCSKLGKPKKPPKKETFSRSFSDINVEKFREALAGISWQSVTEPDSTNDAAHCFIGIFGTLFDLYFPLLRKKVNTKFIPVNGWMSQDLLLLRQINKI